MARIVGAVLVLLVLVAMPLKYLADQPVLVEVIGPPHGLLYLVYLAAVIDLARHVRLTGWQLAAMVTAGLIPFLTFVVERRIDRIAAAQGLGVPLEEPLGLGGKTPVVQPDENGRS